MTQRLEQHNKIVSRPKLEPWHKQAQSPTKVKAKQVAQTKWGVYTYHVYVSLEIK